MPFQPSFAGHLLPRKGSVEEDVAQVHRLPDEMQLADLAAREVEHVPDEPAQMLGAGGHVLEVPGRVGREHAALAGLAEHDVAEADDEAQRSAQLVADHREKAALELVGLFGQAATLEGLSVELDRPDGRAKVVHDRGTRFEIRRRHGGEPGGRIADSNRQDNQLYGLVARPEISWWESVRVERFAALGQAGADHDPASSDRIVIVSDVRGTEEVVDADSWQVRVEDPSNLGQVARRQKL